MTAITQSRAAEVRPATPAAASPMPQKQKSGDEIWDELLARPESDAFLGMLSAQAHQDFLDGNTEAGGFADEEENDLTA